MNGFLAALLNVSTIVFAASSMLSVGFGNTLRGILGPLRDAGAVIRAVLANFVLVPVLAFGVIRVIPLEAPHALALFLVATAAGAPFLVKLVAAADSNVPLSGSLLVLLLPLSILFMPIVIPRVLPGADLSAGAIARPLMLTMLLPLGAGLVVRTLAPNLALRLQPWMQQLSTVALVLLLLSTVVSNFDQIYDLLAVETILATFIVVGGAFVIGYLLGGPGHESREVLGLGTGQRNIAAAIVVATQTVRLPATTSMVVFVSILGLALLFGITVILRRSGRGEAGEDRAAARGGSPA